MANLRHMMFSLTRYKLFQQTKHRATLKCNWETNWKSWGLRGYTLNQKFMVTMRSCRKTAKLHILIRTLSRRNILHAKVTALKNYSISQFHDYLWPPYV